MRLTEKFLMANFNITARLETHSRGCLAFPRTIFRLLTQMVGNSKGKGFILHPSWHWNITNRSLAQKTSLPKCFFLIMVGLINRRARNIRVTKRVFARLQAQLNLPTEGSLSCLTINREKSDFFSTQRKRIYLIQKLPLGWSPLKVGLALDHLTPNHIGASTTSEI